MGKSLRSVHITNYYHKDSGGVSTSYNNLLEAAARHKRYIRLIVPDEHESVEDVNEFARIYYVPAKYSPVFDKRYRLIMPWQYMLTDSIVRRILLEERPDMIEVADKYSLSLLGPMIRTNYFHLLGRPMLVHFSCERMDDNIESFITGGLVGKWFARRLVGNYLFPNFDFHIANSSYTAEEFHQAVNKSENPRRSERFLNACWRLFRAPRVPFNERIFVCPRGVDINQFSTERKSEKIRSEMRRHAGIPDESVVLLYAGRVSPEKNIGLLVEMMKILAADKEKDYRLLVAGGGPKSDWLGRQTAKFFPGKIVHLGHLDKELLSDYYANADVFVHPNPREPFGIAPLEAMASGLPTLAPNSGGILSYATNDNAWLTEPSGKAFAAAVDEIIKNDDFRETKIKNALSTVRDNTQEASTDHLLATYDNLYEDFQSRRELFTDVEAAKPFDFQAIVDLSVIITITAFFAFEIL